MVSAIIELLARVLETKDSVPSATTSRERGV